MLVIGTHHVVSSNINRVGYHNQTLYISFNSGGVYSYTEVPYLVFLEFLGAESAGKFFHARIKGRFDYQKLDADPFDQPSRVHVTV